MLVIHVGWHLPSSLEHPTGGGNFYPVRLTVPMLAVACLALKDRRLLVILRAGVAVG